MANRPVFTVKDQILLANIGGVVAVGVFGQQVIKGLVFVRPQLGRDLFVPFLGIVELRIDIDNHAAKWVHAMTNDRTNTEFRQIIIHHDSKTRPAGQRCRTILKKV